MTRTTRRAAKALAAPAIALSLLAAALSAAPASAATDDYTFTNPNGTLNATGNYDTNQISVTPDGTNYTNWRLIKLDKPGEFNIANTSSGKCIYATQPATQQSCGKDGEQWHFRPIDGKPDTFAIARRDDAAGTEYCMDNRGGLHLWGILAQPNTCNGTPTQEWKLPASKATEARALATDYYAALCARDTSTCSWTEKSEGEPQALPRVKASSVWYNGTGDKASQLFTVIYHSGWSQTLSSSIGTSVGVSVPLQAMVSAQLTAGVTYTSDSTTVNGIVATVPDKHYAWVDFAAVGKKVTGTWTFNTGSQPWTTDATVTVPVVDSQAGSTMYAISTSATPPTGNTSPAREPAAQTLATTTSAKLSLPAGTHLTTTADSAVVADAQGRPVMRMHPGTVTDTHGTRHAYKLELSADGSTLTQTIEGATGETLEGSETLPTVTMGPGTFPVTTRSAMRPMRSDGDLRKDCAKANGHTCSDKEFDDFKKSRDWTKCVGQWTIGTGIAGAVTGGLGAGVGAIPGGILGVIGGGTAGLVVCSF
ncbi:hypothetical protein LKL35_36125 [Streptomyces sp. ET3-23]|uniref:hypothetical protein n=1 Tax=Streptomyces sp. ET3-23 TaxID=2885643 RepID=UPI001D1269AC|nr:hypothetical protein [Streptomyces sp. ET3-23]MCC2280762.1 hypothetical protein [Streptomyces sp. ET3-23]